MQKQDLLRFDESDFALLSLPSTTSPWRHPYREDGHPWGEGENSVTTLIIQIENHLTFIKDKDFLMTHHFSLHLLQHRVLTFREMLNQGNFWYSISLLTFLGGFLLGDFDFSTVTTWSRTALKSLCSSFADHGPVFLAVRCKLTGITNHY